MDRNEERGRAVIGFVAGAAACALVAWLILQEPSAPTPPVTTDESGVAPGSGSGGLTASGASAPEYLRAEGTASRKQARASVEPARGPAAVATTVHGERLLQAVSRIGALLKSERAEEEKGEEAEEAWEREWEALTARLGIRVSASVELARLMRSEMDTTTDEALAIRLARILRSSSDDGFLQEMVRRVTGAREPMQRRTAMLVLETKDARLWYDPVTTAYHKDVEPVVRDEAAYVLGRSLADRKHIRVHRKLRADIQSELGAKDPAARVRALRTMMADRTAGPDDLRRARALLDAEEPSVRQMAASTVRVLEPRVQALLDRRARRDRLDAR